MMSMRLSSSMANVLNSSSRFAPQLVALVAEVFEPEPDGIGVGDQVGAPVVEDLQPTDLDVALLDVDPVVRNESARGAIPVAVYSGRRILHFEALEQQPDGDEVAIDRARWRFP